VPLDLYRLGKEIADEDGGFGRACGIGPGGAVLVRPDGYISWRAIDAGAGPEVAAALARMLCRTY
jgi:putative polyketide hydroxylase